MKNNASFSRYTVLLVVILCYLLPVIGLSGYSNVASGWEVMSLGFLTASLGSLAIFFVMLKAQSTRQIVREVFQEASIPETPITNSETLYPTSHSNEELEHAIESNRRLQADIDALKTELEGVTQEKIEALDQVQSNLIEWDNYRQQVCKQMEQQQAQIHTLQEAMAERQAVYDKKQQQIGLLESKVGDLTYEIKTLLQLAETHSGSLYSEAPSSYTEVSTAQAAAPHSHSIPDYHHEDVAHPIAVERQVRTVEEASLQLKRCIDIAQKITGAQRFMTQFNAFRDYPADGFALDLRRLCDSLRSENNSTILLYSPKENQLLFANNQIRGLTGWSPDKFVQNFNDIIQDEKIWRQGINNLAMRSEVNIQMPVKMKSGQDIQVSAHLGMIPTGIFKHHAIAVIYQEK